MPTVSISTKTTLEANSLTFGLAESLDADSIRKPLVRFRAHSLAPFWSLFGLSTCFRSVWLSVERRRRRRKVEESQHNPALRNGRTDLWIYLSEWQRKKKRRRKPNGWVVKGNTQREWTPDSKINHRVEKSCALLPTGIGNGRGAVFVFVGIDFDSVLNLYCHCQAHRCVCALPFTVPYKNRIDTMLVMSIFLFFRYTSWLVLCTAANVPMVHRTLSS